MDAAFLLLALAPQAVDDAAAPASTSSVRSVERPGDGRPVCGLGPAFHAGRRAALRALHPDLPLVFLGLPGVRDYRAFRQDKTFWYLTGVESPGAALIVDGEREVLFLPEASARKEVWEGELWDCEDAWVKELTGFTEVRSEDELLTVLAEVLEGHTQVGISLHPTVTLSGGYDAAGPHDRKQAAHPLDGRTGRQAALKSSLEERFEVEVVDVAGSIVALRRVKTPEELDAMRRSARAGALAMVEAMRSTRPGLGEWELEALMSFVQVREGAAGPAYHAIVGSGANSCVLHYSASARTMQAGEVVLIDYGGELDHYTTDITRTWPVDGAFGKRAAEIYDAVLAAQKAGIAAVRPGVSLRDVDEVCTAVFRERGLAELRLHGACHLVGMEVHDPGDRGPVEPGVVFTVEPGLYDRERGIGVRIEDVVVVTAEGCEVITALVPRERGEVEALVRAEGVLDWLASRE